MKSKKMNSEKYTSTSIASNKRGISAVVATVLIILITIAAVAILWAAIIPMINNKLDKGTVCLDATSGLSLENNGYTCYNPNNLSIQIKHGPTTFGLSDIQILISSKGNTESIKLKSISGMPPLPKANEARTFNIPQADITTPVANIDKISIAPIVAVGNQQDICGVTSPVIIKACS